MAPAASKIDRRLHTTQNAIRLKKTNALKHLPVGRKFMKLVFYSEKIFTIHDSM